MARFRKISTQVWGDEKFRRLTPLPPSGQSLLFYLLTAPLGGNVPGLLRGGAAGMAEELGWLPEAFREAFREVAREGIARADWSARLVWLPNAIRHNAPESPNVVRSWKNQWNELPECDLKREAYRTLKAFVEGMGQGFSKAFRETIAEPSAKPSPNQEQEQEQEQGAEFTSRQGAPRPIEPTQTPKPGKAPKPPARKPEAHPRFAEVVKAYHDAFEAVRGAKPAFDAKDGRHVNQLLARLGGDADRAIAVIQAAYRTDPFKARNATIATIAADPSKYLGAAAPVAHGRAPVQPAAKPGEPTWTEEGAVGNPQDNPERFWTP